MAVHDAHTALPGYNEHQILIDGCAECEDRGANIAHAITKLDPSQFERAWQRAAVLQLNGLPGCSHAELQLLRTLAMVQIQLERRGLPMGILPTHVLIDINGTLLESKGAPERGEPT